MKKLTLSLTVLLLVVGLGGCGQTQKAEDQASRYSVKLTNLNRANKQASKANAAAKADNASIERQIQTLSASLSSLNKENAAAKKSSSSQPAAKKTTAPAKASPSTAATLANKNYTGQQEITVNGNNPGFSTSDLSTAKGGWESYHDLDQYNRAVDANALLNQSLMPTSPRTALTWDPTGWKNKRTAHGWLYNRSHLIGFQLSGENNNPKNLITGTQSLNNPLMLAHEDDLAYYLKQSTSHYVRYEVRPIYRGNELVARGVQMRAQSVGDNTIRFNVYIFNVEEGYTINYADGSSVKR